MTFSNGGGFVQAQPTIIEATTVITTDLQSSNFSNAGETGFDLNAGSTADDAGTPANTIQIYSGFQIGPTTADHITLAYSAGDAEVNLFTGASAETAAGALFATTNPAVPSIGTTYLQSPAAGHGNSEIALVPGTATSVPAIGVTAIGGPTIAGVNGALEVGTSASDVWTLVVNNEQSVSTGEPGLIVGDTFTPKSRLLVSPSELLSVTGANVTETLYLNSTNTQTLAGGVLNPTLRQQSALNATGGAPGTGGYAAAVTLTNVPCPASGVITLWMRFLVTGSAATTTSSFVAGSVNVVNVTQGTTPFAATDNRCAQLDGVWGATQLVTLFTQVCASGLGNPLDNLTLSGQFHQNVSNAYSVSKIEFGYIPSL